MHTMSFGKLLGTKWVKASCLPLMTLKISIPQPLMDKIKSLTMVNKDKKPSKKLLEYKTKL
jgi:hypothetical protein